MNQGYLRMTVLEHLSHEPCSGYALVKAIHEHTGWKPSFGSIYPLLERLESEGFVTVTEEGRSKVYHLTESGAKRYREERETSTHAHHAILEQLKVLASMGDEDAAGMVDMFEKPAAPDTSKAISFFHLPEFADMRHEIRRIAKSGLTDEKQKELTIIFTKATSALRKIA